MSWLTFRWGKNAVIGIYMQNFLSIVSECIFNVVTLENDEEEALNGMVER